MVSLRDVWNENGGDTPDPERGGVNPAWVDGLKDLRDDCSDILHQESMNVRARDAEANWIGQRGDFRAVALKTDGYLGMLLTKSADMVESVDGRQIEVIRESERATPLVY